jgi:hypothetical protein
MRTIWKTVLLVTLCVTPAYGQTDLTAEQRLADLNQLASMYAKNYAPYEWKRDVIGFDLLRLNPWLREIHRRDDLDFEETLIDYVASLNDAHSFVSFPSSFSASLPLNVDIYDGKVLIDFIDRSSLPVSQFPFAVGDELIAFDGRPVRDVMASFRKYVTYANPLSTDHGTAMALTYRDQQYEPHAADIADSAVLTIRLAATGGSSTYEVPWIKSGIPISSDGVVSSPGRKQFRGGDHGRAPHSMPGAGQSRFLPRGNHGVVIDDTLPPHMSALAPFLTQSAPDYFAVLNFAAKAPIYAPPPGFVLRRGGSSTDFFLSGTFIASGLRIGFLRLPSMAPPSASTALQQLDAELAYFNANTDGLVVDVTRNSGGSVSFTESVLQRLIPTPFRTMGQELRPTQIWLSSFAQTLMSLQFANAPAQFIQNWQNQFDELLRAYNDGRRLTAPLSLNFTGSLTLSPAANAYKKPLLVLADEFTWSAGEFFSAVIQDNGRAPIFGTRTVGAGGPQTSADGTAYTQSTIFITIGLGNRGRLIHTPDFPPTPYLENVGVRPDIPYDYMTRANLMTRGAPYVQAFTNAIVNLIQQGH